MNPLVNSLKHPVQLQIYRVTLKCSFMCRRQQRVVNEVNKANEYDQKIPQAHTADQATAP